MHSKLNQSTKITFLLCVLLFLSVGNTAPGDTLFSDNFNGTLAQWTVNTAGGGDASIGNETSASGRSMRIRWNTVVVTSNAFNAAVPGAQFNVWIRRGSDAFSEDTDSGEDLIVEYIDNLGTWQVLEQLLGSGVKGEILNRSYVIPANGLHANLRVRFRMLTGSGADYDYWHVDDVVITETVAVPPFGLGGCDDFSGGLANWTIVSGGGDVGISTATFNSAPSSMFTRWNLVTATSSTINTSTANQVLVTAWIRRGDDSFSEDPDPGEDLLFQYLDNTSTWVTLQTFLGSGTDGQIYNVSYTLPANAAHANFQIRFRQLSGNGNDWDYWHIDDVCVLDLAPVAYYATDEKLWNGTPGEVYDGSGQGNFGSRVGNANTLNPGRVCRGVNIPDNSALATVDALNTGVDVDTEIGNTGTVSFWYKSNPAWNGGGDRTLFDASTASRYFYFTLRNNRRLYFYFQDSAGNGYNFRTGNLNFGANTWVHLSVTWDFPNNTFQIYVNGNLDTQSTPGTSGAVANVGNLHLGDNSGIQSYTLNTGDSADGMLDEIYIYNFVASQAVIQQDRDATHTCPPENFDIDHDGVGINCYREGIGIIAEDSLGNPVTTFEGSISISTSTNNGNWFVLDNLGASADLAQGILSDTPGDDNGAATYQFVAADLGTVTLYLENTHDETTNININYLGYTDDNLEGNIVFRPFGFVSTPSPIPTQISGKPFTLTLSAAGQTPAQPNCGVIEEYTGSKNIHFWSAYSTPTSGVTQVLVNSNPIATNEPASASQAITFVNGVANIPVQYNDAGSISIAAKDQVGIGDPATGTTDEVIGGIAPFVVKPFGYDLTVTGNPNATGGGDPVFATAGNNFSVTLRSVLWSAADDGDNNGVPDDYSTLTDNGITPNIVNVTGALSLSPTAQVVTNSNGTLGTSSVNFSNFNGNASPGAGTYTFNQSWDEVGILTVNMNTANFMGSGLPVIGQRLNIGRFIPNDFSLTLTTNLAAQCGAFTYGGYKDGVFVALDKNGQPFNIAGNIIARNTAAATTVNYEGVFAKLTVASSLTASGYNVTAGSPATGTLNNTFSALSFSSGISAYAANNSHYQFNTLQAPFNFRVDLNATDSDTVTGTASTSSVPYRLGRLVLKSAYGPETELLEAPLYSEYYNGTSWVLNTADSCSTYINTQISFDAASYTGDLVAGDTSAVLPSPGINLVSGQSSPSNGFWFSTPVGGHQGTVDIQMDLSTAPWLSFDWNGDNITDNATSTIGFGRFRNSDRIIYWREN